jgi:hypothetical protein
MHGATATDSPASAQPGPTATDETVSLLVTAPPPDKTTDGVYGRFDGDIELSLAAGGAFSSGGPNFAAIARGSFFQTAGMYVAYTDAMGSANAPLTRSLALGVTLRPFFIPRWALNLERGPAILDLTIDSIGFDLGVLWASDTSGGFTDKPGMEAALGFEVPVLGKASGPFVGARGAIRWRGEELAGDQPDPLKPVLFVTLSWHSVIDAGIVDAGDRRLK